MLLEACDGSTPTVTPGNNLTVLPLVGVHCMT